MSNYWSAVEWRVAMINEMEGSIGLRMFGKVEGHASIVIPSFIVYISGICTPCMHICGCGLKAVSAHTCAEYHLDTE